MSDAVPPRDRGIELALARGVELFNAREFFLAHEIWEEAWGDSQLLDRHLLQGLIQVAAGFYKLQTGMPSGTVKLLDKGAGHLRQVPTDFYDLELEPLLGAVDGWLTTAKTLVAEWRTDFDVEALPRLTFRRRLDP